MRQIFTQFGMIVALLLSFLPASAYDFEVDGIYYNAVSISNLTCEVTHGDENYTGDITIPEKVTFNNREFKVIGIAESAFYWCSKLTSISIPNSVTSIGSSAFTICSSLTSVAIPNSVTSIGSYAFASCSSLTSVTIPNSVTSIDSSAFKNCSSLSSITIPDSVTYIGQHAFENCSSLTSIAIPDSVKQIIYSTFCGCTSLTSVTIPNSVTHIGEYAFQNCSSLTSITIPDSVIEIYGGAFENCSSLTSIAIPDSVTYFGYKNKPVLKGCTALESIKIGGSFSPPYSFFEELKSLSSLTISGLDDLNIDFYGSDFLFQGCNNLKELNIEYSPKILSLKYVFSFDYKPKTLGFYFDADSSSKLQLTYAPIEKFYIDRNIDFDVNIEGYSAIYIPDLKELTMGQHFTSMDKMRWGDKLETITCYATTPPSYDSFSNREYMFVVVKVPQESLEAYQNADGWKNFWNLQGVPNISGVDKIESESASKLEAGRYNLNGMRVNEDYKGIVIVRFSDGSTKKMIQR